MRFAFALLAATGCSAIHDAQYEDRAEELEEFRKDFLADELDVEYFTSGGSTVYWLDHVGPLRVLTLHGETATRRIDYTFPSPEPMILVDDIVNNWQMSSELIVDCSASTTRAFDANAASAVRIAQTSEGFEKCAVAGRDVYFFVADVVRRWQPFQGPHTALPIVLDLNVAIGEQHGSPAAIAVAGNQMVIAEGGRLWLIDLTKPATAPATYLDNEDPPTGKMGIIGGGILFETNEGTTFIEFATLAETKLAALVADGGYRMSSAYSDIHEPSDGLGGVHFALYGKHIIYRSVRGIFAYGIESKKVVDVLLDRGDPDDASLVYAQPVVTSDGTLYVQDVSGFSSVGQEVYSVDLNGRLR